VGLALVTSLAGTVQLVVAAVILRRKLGGLDARRVIRSYAIYLLATIPAAAAGVGLLFALDGTTEGGFAVDSKPTAALSMVIIGGVMGLVYLGVLALLRTPELRAVTGPLLARLRRSR